MYNHLTLQMYDPTLARSDYVGKAERTLVPTQPWSGCRFSKLSDKNDMFYIFIMCGGFWVCNRSAVGYVVVASVVPT